MYSKRSIFSIVVLAIIVTMTSWWSIYILKPSSSNKKTKEVSNTINKANLVKYGISGSPDYIINANKIVRFNNGQSDITTINSLLYSKEKNAPPWHMRSNYGLLYDAGKKLKLWGNVVLYRNKTKTDLPLRAETSTVTIFPDTKQAFTKAPVTIYQPNTENCTTAIGMHADLNKKIITLLSDAKSTYTTQGQNEA